MKRLTSDGFSLVEILVAISILSIMSIGLAGTLMGIGRSGEDVRTRTESAFFMQEILENARVVPYAALGSGSATRAIGGGVTLRADWTVTEVVTDKLKQADFRVYRQPALPTGDAERAVRVYYANRNPP